MQVSDIPAVMVIEECSFPSPWPESAYHYELTYKRDSSFWVLQARQSLDNPGETLGSLRESGEIQVLGYYGLRFSRREAHLCTIAIHPHRRGRGLGEYALLAALGEAVRHGARRVTLEMRPSNHVAHKLYTKVGFIQTGIRYAYYRDGEDAWLMSLGPLNSGLIVRLRELLRTVEARLRV
jgi:ribosomal-protein-alanine N-acetyltransferase